MEKRSCSIELEPRTLSQVQLIQVREVAADVVQKLEPREASALFVEGLMHPMKDENGGKIEKAEDILDDDDDDDDEIKECQCQCSFNNENTNHVNLKEPLSAPF